MPKTCYVPKKFNPKHQAVIDSANEIIAEYRGQGFELTLRQLYYQFVSRDLIPNNQREYKNLGSILNDARLAGQVDWEAIVDRTRNLQSVASWESPADIVGACARGYKVDLWEGQTYRPEVWIEKDALVGVIEGVCNELRVPYFSCRGYTSQSELWAAGMRLGRHARRGQKPFVLHFGDHDPSGIDMTRDIRERLEMFAGRPVELERMALNMDQIEQYQPPPNPAKLTDSRCASYMAEHGDESWELDALSPEVIATLIRERVNRLIDKPEWDEAEAREAEEKRQLQKLADNWEDFKHHLED